MAPGAARPPHGGRSTSGSSSVQQGEGRIEGEKRRAMKELNVDKTNALD